MIGGQDTESYRLGYVCCNVTEEQEAACQLRREKCAMIPEQQQTLKKPTASQQTFFIISAFAL